MTCKAGAVFFFASIALLPAFAVSLYCLKPKEKAAPIPVFNGLEASLLDGDIICRLGDRLWSSYFRDISPVDKRFSHLGIVRVVDGHITVINAEGLVWEGRDFVNEVELSCFLEQARAVGVYRFKGASGGLLSSAASLLKGKPFDWDFDLNDAGKLYCTEVLYRALKDTAPDYQMKTVYQKQLGKEIIPLEAVSHSEDFSEVLYKARP